MREWNILGVGNIELIINRAVKITAMHWLPICCRMLYSHVRIKNLLIGCQLKVF